MRATEHPTQPPQDGVPHPVHASTPAAQGPPIVLDPTAPLERHPYPRRRHSLSPVKLVPFFPRLGRHRSCCSVDEITSERPFPPHTPRTTPPRGTNHDRSGQRIETDHVYRRGNSPAPPSNNVLDGPRPLSAVGAGGQGTGGPSLERATQQIPGPRTDDRREENGGSVEHTSRSQHNIDFLSAISAIVALHSLVTGQHSDRPAHGNIHLTRQLSLPPFRPLGLRYQLPIVRKLTLLADELLLLHQLPWPNRLATTRSILPQPTLGRKKRTKRQPHPTLRVVISSVLHYKWTQRRHS